MLVTSTFSINLGPAFIKFFQIIEILGKLYFTPIKYSNLLDFFLSTINGLSDLVQLPANFLINSNPSEESHSLGKLTSNSIQRHLLRSTPFFLPLHISLTILGFVLGLLDRKGSGQRRYRLDAVSLAGGDRKPGYISQIR